MDILDAAVWHVKDVMRQRPLFRRDLQEAVLEALVGEVLRILGIHHTHAIHDETIGIHVGGSRTEGNAPNSCSITLHLFPSGKLNIHHDGLGRVVLVVEGHGAVVVTLGLCTRRCGAQHGCQAQ